MKREGMHRPYRLLACLMLLVSGLAAQSKGAPEKGFLPKLAADEAHEYRIYGIEVGMTTPEVLDKLGGRMPDKREDKDGEIIVYWKTDEGVLQVRFRDENYVSFIGLQFRPPRPTNDFWLSEVRTGGSSSELTAPDPRLRRDYQLSESSDQQRAAWKRSQKAPSGYEVEISFLSSDKRKAGTQYSGQVEFKYVMVPPMKVRQFDQWARQQSGKK